MPRWPEGPKRSVHVKVYFTQEEHEELDDMAIRKKISQSELLRESWNIARARLEKKHPDKRTLRSG